MTKIIISNRLAGKNQPGLRKQSRQSLDQALDSELLSKARTVQEFDQGGEGRKISVQEIEDKDLAQLKEELPSDLIVEEEILHYRQDQVYPADLAQFTVAESHVASRNVIPFMDSFKLRFLGGNKPLVGAAITVFLRFPMEGIQTISDLRTDEEGRVTFFFNGLYDVAAVLIAPPEGYYTKILRAPRNEGTYSLTRLPNARRNRGWWHEFHQITSKNDDFGQGVKVGVVDTGCGPHPFLDHVKNIGAFINNQKDPEGGSDVDLHGTHVCGSVGARPTSSSFYAGIAPGVELYSARVFPPNSGASQADIANALDELSEIHQVHLINMSLGSSRPSQILQDAIQNAFENGSLCICAAGNDGGPVGYPAAFPETVAVSAMGLAGYVPCDSTAYNLPTSGSAYGIKNYFLATFSNFGEEIDTAAPGVGIISTVPNTLEGIQTETPYKDLNGTSMASPNACGALAAVLAQDRRFLSLPASSSRSQMARMLLSNNANSLLIDATLQGEGAIYV